MSENVFVGERRFWLNQAKTKYVSICLSTQLNNSPCVIISGTRNNTVVLSEKEWCDLLSYKKIITNSIITPEIASTIDLGSFAVEFKVLPHSNIVRIFTGDSSVRLGSISLFHLWKIVPLIQFRIEFLKQQPFSDILQILRGGTQDELINISALETLKEINPEVYTLGLEVIYNYPELLKEDTKV